MVNQSAMLENKVISKVSKQIKYLSRKITVSKKNLPGLTWQHLGGRIVFHSGNIMEATWRFMEDVCSLQMFDFVF